MLCVFKASCNYRLLFLGSTYPKEELVHHIYELFNGTDILPTSTEIYSQVSDASLQYLCVQLFHRRVPRGNSQKDSEGVS